MNKKIFSITLFLGLIPLLGFIVYLNIFQGKSMTGGDLPEDSSDTSHSSQVCGESAMISALVDGDSMANIIQNGSSVNYLSGAYDCGKKIHAGDIVVVGVGKNLLVKRVVAVGGDAWSYTGGTVYVNDAILKTTLGEPYTLRSPLLERLAGLYPTVPANSILVFGNKSTGSFDSSIFGFFGINDVRGQVNIGNEGP